MLGFGWSGLDLYAILKKILILQIKKVRLRPTCGLDLVGLLQANCLSLVEPQLNPSLFRLD